MLRQLLVYALGTGVPGLGSVLLLGFYTRHLSTAEYGTVAVTLSAALFIRMLAFQWLELSVFRMLPANLRAAPDSPEPVLRTALGVVGILSLVMLASGAILIASFELPVSRQIAVAAVLIIIAQTWFDLNQGIKRRRFQAVQYGFQRVRKTIIEVIAGVALILLGFGASAPLLGLLIGLVLASALSNRSLWLGNGAGVDVTTLKQMASYGLPLTASLLAVHVMSISDYLMLVWLVGPDSVGTYSAASAISAHSVTLVMMVVNLAAYPHALRAYETEGIPGAEKQLGSNLNLMLMVALPATALLIVLSSDIAHVVLGAEFREEATRLIPVIAAAAFVAGMRSYLFDLAFQLSKRTRGQAAILGVTATINIALNFILIPAAAAFGAALATLISLMMALVMSAWFGRKFLRIRTSLPECLKIIAAVVLASGVATIPEMPPGAIGLASKALCATAVYGIFLYLANVAGLRRDLNAGLVRLISRR